MKKALQGLAQEISRNLELELKGQQETKGPTSVAIADLVLQKLAQEVVKELRITSSTTGSYAEDIEARLQKMEKKLEQVATSTEEDEDEDEIAGSGSSFPNLKYAKPKYKSIESILKYVESDEDKGGVKLVIMNFND